MQRLTVSLVIILAGGLACGVQSNQNPIGPPSTPPATTTTHPPNGQAAITVDFQNRVSREFAVPSDLIGAGNGYFGSQEAQALATLNESGLGLVRVELDLESVYSNTQPDWTAIDQSLSAVQSAHMHAIVIIIGTPSWLAPNPNPCQTGGHDWAHAVPTDLRTWGGLAASFVGHVNQSFPGVVKYYEIWNEPDLVGFLCSLPVSTLNTRMQVYAQMYVAAGQAMKAQAAADGVQILVGGPATSNGWVTAAVLPTFVSNPGVARYLDFVSYHYYPAPKGYSSWDQTNSGLLAMSLDGDHGFAAFYEAIALQTAKGVQPNAASTPVMITEYNDAPQYGTNCCRNSATYSPLFNSIAVSELLNSVYAGAARVPATLSYYRAKDWNSFCLLATPDTNCIWSSGPLAPFPQLYAFELISSPQYLGLSSGSFLVPTKMALPDPLRGSAFYGANSGALLLINPSSSTYNGTVIMFSNAAINGPTATMFLLNASNPTVNKSSLSLSSDAQQNLHATVDIPPYSVIGIRIQ